MATRMALILVIAAGTIAVLQGQAQQQPPAAAKERADAVRAVVKEFFANWGAQAAAKNESLFLTPDMPICSIKTKHKHDTWRKTAAEWIQAEQAKPSEAVTLQSMDVEFSNVSMAVVRASYQQGPLQGRAVLTLLNTDHQTWKLMAVVLHWNFAW